MTGSHDTMTSTTTATESPLPLIELARASRPDEGPAWLASIRGKALECFTRTGLPTTRDEAWRFTSLAPLERTRFATAEPRPGAVAAEELADSVISMDLAARLVFVNGHVEVSLTSSDGVPAGVTVTTLREALRTHADLIEAHFAGIESPESDAFTALNTAMGGDGVFVHVPAGMKVEHPIGVRHLASPSEGAGATAHHPRCLIIAEEDAQVTVAERFSSRSEGDEYLSNALTEIHVGARARVAHYYINRESRSAFCVNSRHARIHEKAHFESHAVILGGAITRNNVTLSFDGEDADGVLNGVYVAGKGQHVDNAMRVLHNKPHCRSRQFYKGLLTDDARGVFTGRIIVDRIAQKTDAIQSNRNLLLSPDARANSRPQLEIYADDVRCTHGATVGELDEEAMFYLRARGMSEDVARAVLVGAFARENIERMDLAPVREWLIRQVLSRLPGTDILIDNAD